MNNDTNGLPGWAQELARILNYVSAAGIFLLVALVFVSVFFRYVLNSPILATEDVTALLLGITVFTGYPMVTLTRKHINVDLMTGPIIRRPKLNRIRLIIIDIGVFAMTLFVAKLILDQAIRFQQRQTGTLLMDWPLYPFAYVIVVLLVIAASLFALRAVRDRSPDDKWWWTPS